MADETANLMLPYLLASQAQKHVTVNESLTQLDGLVQLAVQSRTITAQPGAPDEGVRYILPAGYLSILQTRKLITAGEAQAINSALRAADEAIIKAKAARNRVAADLAAEPDRLREPDEFSRD